MRDILVIYASDTDDVLTDFFECPLAFLYTQEDRTGYKCKTISKLIDELQELIPFENETVYEKLTDSGKRRWDKVVRELKMVE